MKKCSLEPCYPIPLKNPSLLCQQRRKKPNKNKTKTAQNLKHSKGLSKPDLAFPIFTEQPPTSLRALTLYSSLPGAGSSFLYMFLTHLYFSPSDTFCHRALYPPSDCLPRVLSFTRHCCLETGTYLSLFMVQSVSSTPCLPPGSGFYTAGFSAFWYALSVACHIPHNIKPW